MSVPKVQFQKVDFQTGSVAQSPIGVLACIIPAESGPQNEPSSYARDDLAFDDFGPCPLVEALSYDINTSGNSAVAIRPTASIAASYGAIDTSEMGTGTSVPTAQAGTFPTDNYPVTIDFLTGGTIGIAGITYTYSLDGVTVSAPQNLPATSPALITIPDFSQGGSPGVVFSMAAGSVLPGSFFCQTRHAQVSNGDLSTALEALRVSGLAWEGVLIDQEVSTGTTALVDDWLEGLEAGGKFRFALLNTAMKNPGESETAYASRMAAVKALSAPSIREVVGTDGANLPSTLTGLILPRPTSYLVAARAMKIAIGVDPAFVGDGPIDGAVITDGKKNPIFHNEELYPNLDQLLLTALRSVANDDGVYINNANVFSTNGSDYVFLPHVRTMNRACEVAFAQLVKELGRGVGKKPADPNTGGVYILEEDALTIEGMVNGAVEAQLAGQVQDVRFALSRTDDLSANTGATVNGTLTLVALAYIKGIKVLAAFAKSIKVAA